MGGVGARRVWVVDAVAAAAVAAESPQGTKGAGRDRWLETRPDHGSRSTSVLQFSTLDPASRRRTFSSLFDSPYVLSLPAAVGIVKRGREEGGINKERAAKRATGFLRMESNLHLWNFSFSSNILSILLSTLHLRSKKKQSKRVVSPSSFPINLVDSRQDDRVCSNLATRSRHKMRIKQRKLLFTDPSPLPPTAEKLVHSFVDTIWSTRRHSTIRFNVRWWGQ